MLQKIVFKILVSPLALIYGLGVSLHNAFYSLGILKGLRFNIPLISVGNLSVGGTGKTPHIEYLIRMLKPYVQIAVLSRGYRRKTKGFRYVVPESDANQVGDEPLQYKKKYPEITVAIAERRAFAIPQMISQQADIQTILLDDAFQHRAVTPGLNILLTPYSKPFTRDFLIPLGRLREWRSAYERADKIIISKCPDTLSIDDRKKLIQEINPYPHQEIFFSKYQYLDPYYLLDQNAVLQLENDMQIIVLCALASTDYLIDYLEKQVTYLEVIEYEDHHYYTEEDIQKLHRRWASLEGKRNLILTTEKDATRLQLLRPLILKLQLPIFVLPIEVRFLDQDAQRFAKSVQQFLLDFKV